MPRKKTWNSVKMPLFLWKQAFSAAETSIFSGIKLILIYSADFFSMELSSFSAELNKFLWIFVPNAADFFSTDSTGLSPRIFRNFYSFLTQNNVIINNCRRSPMCREVALCAYVLCNMSCTHVYYVKFVSAQDRLWNGVVDPRWQMTRGFWSQQKGGRACMETWGLWVQIPQEPNIFPPPFFFFFIIVDH